MDWTKVWGKKYPILNEYDKKIEVEGYNIKIKEMIEDLKVKYGFSTQDAMLVIKDILYKEYLKIK